jgi:hypothetical protein
VRAPTDPALASDHPGQEAALEAVKSVAAGPEAVHFAGAGVPVRDASAGAASLGILGLRRFASASHTPDANVGRLMRGRG